jgi:pimeloyl-ACP methyl ester carboxylesterase
MFAILTIPNAPAREVVAIIAHGRGDNPTFHRNRLSARLAWRLADHGFHAVRFDYPGTADSTGSSRGFSLTINQSREVMAVMDHLTRSGFSRFVLIGYCVGGRSILAAAKDSAGVEAVILAATPLMTAQAERSRTPPHSEEIRDTRGFPRRSPLRRLGARLVGRARRLSRRFRGTRVDPSIRQGFRHLAKRRVPALLVYGARDDYVQEARDMFRISLLDDSTKTQLQLHESAGFMHGFLSTDSQAELIDSIEEWVTKLDRGRSSPRRQ